MRKLCNPFNHILARIGFVSTICIISFILSSCDRSAQEAQRLKEENEKLQEQVDSSLENVEAYFAALNEIEENLLLIRQKEDLIARETSRNIELGVNQKERINEDLRQIGKLMEMNRQLLANLNRRVKNSDLRIEEFQRSVKRLNHSIEEKEIEIQVLKDYLGQMNLKVDYLTARVDTLERDRMDRDRQIQNQILELNRAYYAIGSQKELIDNNVISREGGFLGLGRTNRLRTEVNPDFFTRIDMTKDYEVFIPGSDPQLITTHPSDSYQIISDEDGGKVLQISNAPRFWETTRYLVIQIK
jgi:uncharacterized membrane-anchored protein YhcB (DUF1043 family)